MKTVLIVDDSDFVVQMLRFTLEQEGYTILAGVDGQDALKHFDGLQPIDMMITDLHMPVLDGLGLINAVRLNAAYQHIPIVLFDSHSAEDKEYLNKTGATTLLSKDMMGDLLIATVKQMIG